MGIAWTLAAASEGGRDLVMGTPQSPLFAHPPGDFRTDTPSFHESDVQLALDMPPDAAKAVAAAFCSVPGYRFDGLDVAWPIDHVPAVDRKFGGRMTALIDRLSRSPNPRRDPLRGGDVARSLMHHAATTLACLYETEEGPDFASVSGGLKVIMDLYSEGDRSAASEVFAMVDAIAEALVAGRAPEDEETFLTSFAP